ncbi:hypothetical protein H6G89_30580 [Oscillatoria sp. FACHB-1407]|uniref:hypothetical protein n=1 Tax=Oscillatoria sp. FACHB-1407 TaxID=2692847 RepID=UPI001683892E|nr:hypothetical protein [Oscillatoria sp. FACHB-1407]MBD2465361.1 hypothetical protein [Oscillatoria sp. FACHB-1407]
MRQTQAGYWLDREELMKIRDRKLLSSDRDYLYFALQIDYPGKLNPQIDVDAFCDRWNLSAGDFYKALGDLKNKRIVEAISNQLNLHLQETV